jgi:hypothetical protein
LIPEHIALDKVDFWFQDEARIGQQNTTTQLWAQKGSRPRRERTEAILAPWINKGVMKQHLELICAATRPGRHAAQFQ